MKKKLLVLLLYSMCAALMVQRQELQTILLLLLYPTCAALMAQRHELQIVFLLLCQILELLFLKLQLVLALRLVVLLILGR
jgi:hypothetical protein